MQKQLQWLLIGAFTGALLVYSLLPEPPHQKWCLFREYESLKEFKSASRLPEVYVEMNGRKARVHVPCPLPH